MDAKGSRSYFSRLLSRAWKETKGVWNLYRWWIAIAGALFPLAVLVIRHGWTGLLNAGDVAINSIGGCLLAFAGSWAISLVRSFKLLDDDRASDAASQDRVINSLESEKESLLDKLKKPTLSDADQAKRQLVQEKLRNASVEETDLLRYLLLHGKTDPPTLTKSPEWHIAINNMLIARLVSHIPAGPGQPSFQQYYELNSELKDAIAFYLGLIGPVTSP